MKAEETRKVVKTLGGLFPSQLTQEQAKFLWDQLAPFSFAETIAAIKAHRAAHDFLNIPQLLEGCRATNARTPTKTTTATDQTWFDVRREQNPQLRGRPDTEVALRVCRSFWFRCSKNDSYKRQYARECQMHLIMAGVPIDQVVAWAETIFESPEFFQRCIEDIRGVVLVKRDVQPPPSAYEAEQLRVAALFGDAKAPAPQNPSDAARALARADAKARASETEVGETAGVA